MEILFLSQTVSGQLQKHIFEKTKKNPGFAIQKFNRLVMTGIMENGVKVTALSTPGVTHKNYNRRWISFQSEVENGLKYNYIPFINFPGLKQVCIFLYVFFYVLSWGLSNKKEKSIVCDVLCISASMAALLASKIIGLSRIAIVTDIYSLMIGKPRLSFGGIVKHLAGILQSWYSKSFSHYVLLTEQMNELINPNKMPYVVMEALCENPVNYDKMVNIKKNDPKIVMYAGGIEEKYGLKMLIDSFRMIKRKDVNLHLYGSGSYVEDLKKICEEDCRIIYKGLAPNEEILKAEIEATLLVNPRFSTEDYTKYSFPSKNIEYMVSGTALVTTKLPGMPDEYLPFVYLFNEETTEGYAKVIENIISKPYDELIEFGYKARNFVLEEKNKKKQTNKIIELIKSN